MSQCSNCLEGLCRKHPAQDHGIRAAQLLIKAAEMKSVLIRNACAELSKSAAVSRLSDRSMEDEEMKYKQEMELSRLKAESRKRKQYNPEADYLATKCGLNPSVVETMIDNNSGEEDGDSSSASNNSDNSDSETSDKKASSSSSSRSGKKKRKEKSHKSEKKRHKEHKKSKKSRKSHHRDK